MRRPTLLLICLVFALPGSGFAQDIPESSVEAIAAHAEGLRAYVAQDYRAAIPHFLRAHELDPTFYVPLFMAALDAGNAGMTALADSLWDVVSENRSHFSDYYRRLIDIYVMRRNGGDWAESMELARSVAADYPGTKANYNLALWSNTDGKPRQALTALATMDPDREPMKGWFSFFAVKCGALHRVDDPDADLQCARDAVDRFPERREGYWFMARAYAAQGRASEALAAVETGITKLQRMSGYSDGNMYGAMGLAFLTHGCGDALADEYLDRAVTWYEDLPPERAQTNAMRRQHAYWLYARGDFEASYQAYKQIVADLGSVNDRGQLGILAGLAGHRAEALEIRTAFLAGEVSPMPPQQHYMAAMISAAVGDLDAAADHFGQTWSTGNTHLEPVFLFKMRDHPAFIQFSKPRG